MFIIFILCFFLPPSMAEFSLAKYFTSHMVLQEAPRSATIFGTYSEGPVIVSLDCQSGLSYQYVAELNQTNMMWSVHLDPINSGEICQIEIVNLIDTVVLEDIMFGDVWFCSGQSNMGWSMLGIDNKTEEVAASQNYTNIRMFRIQQMTSSKEENDLLEEEDGWKEWASPATDDGDRLMHFSAICFLFARGISNYLGNKPLGLIASSYAGTRIEAWSPPETLETCGVEDHVEPEHDYNSNSHLYNAMIHPFIKMSIKGVLWYQGEANTFWNPDKYKCMLKNMFHDWRMRWWKNSDTHYKYPVGVVQLGPMGNPPIPDTRKNDGNHFPLLRWHQTLDVGFLPNSEEENGFSAMAMDTYYMGQVHPHNKQLPAHRLAIAGLSVAYKKPEFPSRGPFPKNFQVNKVDAITYVDIRYDEDPIFYLPGENSGFFYCCGENNSSSCLGDQVVPATDWKLVSIMNVKQMGTDLITVNVPSCNGPASLGYLWAESPVTITHGLPIYSNNKYGLPAAPWWKIV